MGRRRREVDLAEGIVGVFAFIFLLALLTGGTKAVYALLGILIGAAVAASLGFVLFRIIVRSLQKPESPRPIRVVDLADLGPEVTAAPPAPVVVCSPPPAPENPFRVERPPVDVSPLPDLIARLEKIDWFQFEKLVALMYRRLGYRVERRGGAKADGGIDLLIEREGRRLAVQCKQWRAWKVGLRAVREFLGALTDNGIEEGIFVTVRGYTGEAKEFAKKHRIEILDEAELLRLLRRSGVAEDPEAAEIMSDTRKYCPKCESEMRIRVAGRGPGRGEQFWGCSRYPRCNYRMPLLAKDIRRGIG